MPSASLVVRCTVRASTPARAAIWPTASSQRPVREQADGLASAARAKEKAQKHAAQAPTSPSLDDRAAVRTKAFPPEKTALHQCWQSYPHSLAWRWTRFRSGRGRVSPWRRRRVSGIAAGRRRGGRPIPGRRPIPRGRWRVISRRHTSAAIWTKTIARRAHASIWDAVAIRVTMKAGAAASRHEKNIRFRKWSWEPCSRRAPRTVGKHQA
jgi:hypothetical protein